jgi:hypothetical protein
MPLVNVVLAQLVVELKMISPPGTVTVGRPGIVIVEQLKYIVPPVEGT